MFERFSDSARRVVVSAQEESGQFGHNYIGTEHLLLGLALEQTGVVARTLRLSGISHGYICDQIENIIGTGGSPRVGHVSFSPRAKKVLELSQRQALQLGHTWVNTEHLLLALIEEGEGVAAQIMATKANLSDIRALLVRQLANALREREPTVKGAIIGVQFTKEPGQAILLVAVPDTTHITYRDVLLIDPDSR